MFWKQSIDLKYMIVFCENAYQNNGFYIETFNL